MEAKKGRHTTIIIYLLVMVITVVSVDLLFFRHHSWERLIANIGMVLVYIAVYLAYFNH